MRNVNKGYTLIELMIVLGVVLILSAMAIPSFRNMKDRARVNVARDAVQGLRLAQKIYQLDGNIYTTSLTNMYPYGNITGFLRELNAMPTISVDNTTERFTISARARDRATTLITGTERGIISCNPSGCIGY